MTSGSTAGPVVNAPGGQSQGTAAAAAVAAAVQRPQTRAPGTTGPDAQTLNTPHAQEGFMRALQAVQELRERNLSLREENAELAEELLAQDGIMTPMSAQGGMPQWPPSQQQSIGPTPAQNIAPTAQIVQPSAQASTADRPTNQSSPVQQLVGPQALPPRESMECPRSVLVPGVHAGGRTGASAGIGPCQSSGQRPSAVRNYSPGPPAPHRNFSATGAPSNVGRNTSGAGVACVSAMGYQRFPSSMNTNEQRR